MASKNVIAKGTTYNGVESITLPTSPSGTATFYEVSDTTAVASDVLNSKWFYASDGTYTQGTGTGGGGGSAYTLLASEEFEVNTTSTSYINVGTIVAGSSAYTSDKIVFVKIRDTEGPRDGYYLGSDSVFFNPYPANNATTSMTGKGIGNYRYSGSLFYNSSNSYGVVADSIDSSGNIAIRARYSSTSSLTINGTFKCDVYLLEWPNNISPFVR